MKDLRITLAFVLCAVAPAQTTPPSPVDPARAVQALADNCYGCHGAGVQMSNLQLTSRELMLKGGTRGPAVVPGDAKASRIVQVIEHTAQPNMPPGRQLPQDTIAIIQKWIEAGAPWPAERVQTTATRSTWWSLQKPVRPAVPKMSDPWVRTPIDAFVLAKLQQQGHPHAPEASREVLIRRAYLDLTGLPPTADEITAFAKDPSPNAYDHLIDTLLASPRYGEKWGRMWLDLVRYADSAGFELDPYNSVSWRYRDWVIDSFNHDKPYDRFVKEQIAGDELWPDDPAAKTGTGYFCVGPNMDLYPDQQDINRVQTLTDYVDTTGAAFLGLTVACARCHDHKFDPISQRDYYRLQAIFEPAVKTDIPLGKLLSLGYRVAENTREIKLQEIGDEISSVEQRCRKQLRDQKAKSLPPEVRDAMNTDPDKRTAAQEALLDQMGNRAKVTDDELRACLTPEESQKLHDVERRLVTMYAGYRPKPFACGVTEASRAYPATRVPARGGGFGAPVTPGFLSALGGGDIAEPPDTAVTTLRRKALAEWIGSNENPLTARVIVNRLWQGHFGRGIVATPSDFGARGTRASHAELLDWLAVEFMENGWSIKRLHKQIMMSSVYRQSAEAPPGVLQRDPENIYLSHMIRRRLSAEEIRDTVLDSSGALNFKAGGRPVIPRLNDKELYGLTGNPEDKWIVTADEKEWNRRSIYMFVRRTYRLPMLEVFDAPETVVTCPRRESSTTSTQSLTLLNSDFMVASSRALGSSLAKQNDADAALISAAWKRVLRRAPTPEEAARASAFLNQQQQNLNARESAAAELSRALFNLNEFLYVD